MHALAKDDLFDTHISLLQEGVKHLNLILDSSDVLATLDLNTTGLRPSDKTPGAS